MWNLLWFRTSVRKGDARGFQIAEVRFQIAEVRFQIAEVRFQIAEVRF
jgi:hypothetical protein